MVKTKEQVPTLLAGGWTPYHDLTRNDTKVFNEAMKGYVGVDYTPYLVSTQVVNGTNYRYKAHAKLPGSDKKWDAIIQIYAPIDGKPHVTHIQPI